MKVVQTRSKLENLSKEELIEELTIVEDITSKLSDLSNQFNDFFEEIWSCFLRLSDYKKLQQITNHELFIWKGMQLLMMEVNPVPLLIVEMWPA